MTEREELLRLAADIVSAHARSNSLPTDQLPGLIGQVYGALATVGQTTTAALRPEPAVPVRQSVRSDHIICLDCGKHFSMLKRHLMTDHHLTPDQYRQRWQLPPTYPIVAPAYAKTRSAMAKRIGLGRKVRAVRKAGRKARRS